MVTINGQKMGKSLGNGIMLEQLFSGENNQLVKPYSPMTVRFFILMSHYRSTLDFSNEALGAAEKGFNRLMNTLGKLDKVSASKSSSLDVNALKEKAYEAMNDDFNTPILIAQLFEGGKWINLLLENKESLNETDLQEFKTMMVSLTFDVLGLQPEAEGNSDLVDDLMKLILDIRKFAKENKNYELSDKIRDELNSLKIEIQDGKEGSDWKVNS